MWSSGGLGFGAVLEPLVADLEQAYGRDEGLVVEKRGPQRVKRGADVTTVTCVKKKWPETHFLTLF